MLGSGVIWHGSINGSGGVRIEGAFEGEIALRGMLVIGETGRVKLTTLTKEFFMPRFLERDEGERQPPYEKYP